MTEHLPAPNSRVIDALNELKLCKDCRWVRMPQPDYPPRWWNLWMGDMHTDMSERCVHPKVNARRGAFLVDGEFANTQRAWFERSGGASGEVGTCGRKGKLWEPKR